MIESWAEVEGDFRWTLGRRANERPLMLVCGLNPSTADARQNDPTVLRWLHFALSWGHGGYIAVNVFPFRSSKPAECKKWLADDVANVAKILARNLETIRYQRQECTRAVACWGAFDIEHPTVQATIEALGEPLYCFGTNFDGSPIHVMARGARRVENSQQPVLWTPPGASV